MAAIVTLGLIALVIGTIAYVAYWRSPAGSKPHAPIAALELLSTFEGSHRWPALSPDGRKIAFVSDAAGTPQVWIKDLAAGRPVQVTFCDVPAVRPRWSDRGDRIIYSYRGGGVWSVPPSGGEPRRIVEDGWNADVSPDGRRLVFERTREIFIADADGTGVHRLPDAPGRLIDRYGDAWPTFSPDGRSIAVFLGEHGRHGDYWIIPADGNAPRR